MWSGLLATTICSAPVADGHQEGFCKLVADRDRKTILGGHVLGEYSAEIIQIIVACMSAGMTIDRVAELPFAFRPSPKASAWQHRKYAPQSVSATSPRMELPRSRRLVSTQGNERTGALCRAMLRAAAGLRRPRSCSTGGQSRRGPLSRLWLRPIRRRPNQRFRPPLFEIVFPVTGQSREQRSRTTTPSCSRPRPARKDAGLQRRLLQHESC